MKKPAWFNKGHFLKANCYSSVCGNVFVFRKLIFCCMWRHFILTLFYFSPNSKHCTTIGEGLPVLLCVSTHNNSTHLVIYNCFYYFLQKRTHPHVLALHTFETAMLHTYASRWYLPWQFILQVTHERLCPWMLPADCHFVSFETLAALCATANNCL